MTPTLPDRYSSVSLSMLLTPALVDAPRIHWREMLAAVDSAIPEGMHFVVRFESGSGN